MKNRFVIAIFLQLIAFSLFAQKFEIRIDAGANLTFLPDYENWIYVANDGLIVPGLISINNSLTPVLIGNSTAETSARLGFVADLEIRMKVCDKCNLSLAAGISKLNYKFDSYVDIEGTPNVRLSEIVSDFGNSGLLYINVRPLNFGIDLFNERLTLQAGATFNFFLKGKTNNYVILYSQETVVGGTSQKVEKLYIASTGVVNSILYGIHLRAEYNIVQALEVFISGQYYFNSIYDYEESNSPELKAVKPTVVSAGISYAFWKF